MARAVKTRVAKTRAPRADRPLDGRGPSDGGFAESSDGRLAQSGGGGKLAKLGDGGKLAALLDEYEAALIAERGASSHTVRAYRTDIDAFLRWCERVGVDPLSATHRQLRSYLGDMDAARYARTTVNRRLSSLRGFYAWLNVTGRCDADPASALSGPKTARHLPHVIQPEEMFRLLSVHNSRDCLGNVQPQTAEDMRDQALLEFLYACGARISEAAGLEMGSVDFRSRLVKVFGKGGKERIIPLHDLCIDALRTYIDSARDELLGGKTSKYVFVSTRGNPMSADAMRKVFKAAVRRAGLDEGLSPHDMRHTFATDVLAGGADLRTVQEMLGHASLSTTQIYTHVSASSLKTAHKLAHPRS